MYFDNNFMTDGGLTRTEIGVGLAGMGVAFLFLGVLLLFDKGLLAIGNVSIFFLCFMLFFINGVFHCSAPIPFRFSLLNRARKNILLLLPKTQN